MFSRCCHCHCRLTLVLGFLFLLLLGVSDDAIYKALASVDKDNLSCKELLLICHRCRQLWKALVVLFWSLLALIKPLQLANCLLFRSSAFGSSELGKLSSFIDFTQENCVYNIYKPLVVFLRAFQARWKQVELLPSYLIAFKSLWSEL